MQFAPTPGLARCSSIRWPMAKTSLITGIFGVYNGSALSEKMPILRKLNRAIRAFASATGDDSPISLIGNAFDAEPIVTHGDVSCCGHKRSDTNFRLL